MTFGAKLIFVGEKGGCLVHHRRFSSGPGLYPLDASRIPPTLLVTVKNVSGRCQMSHGRPNRPWLRTTAPVTGLMHSHWGSSPASLVVGQTLRHPLHRGFPSTWQTKPAWFTERFSRWFLSDGSVMLHLIFKRKYTGLPELFLVFETLCGCMFTGKTQLI